MSQVSLHVTYRQTIANTQPCCFVINADDITDELQADSTAEASDAANMPVPTPTDDASAPASGEGSSEPTAAQDEGIASTETPEATSTPEEVETLTVSQPTDNDAPAPSTQETPQVEDDPTTEVTPDVAQDESEVTTEDAADTVGVDEPTIEAVVAPVEVAEAETEANDEGMANAETMQDISDLEKDDDDVTDPDITDWEKDDETSSQSGESETNPSEHQDSENDGIAQDSLDPAQADAKSADDDADNEVVVLIDVKEDEASTEDVPAALVSGIAEESDVSSSTPDETQVHEPSTSAESPELSEPLETTGSADDSTEGQKPIEVTPAISVEGSTEDAQLATVDALAAQELASNISQPDTTPEENSITDSITDVQEDATAHESPADQLEPAVSSEAAKDSEQVMVSATPDDVEHPDSCTGTYLLCFLCFTSLCRLHFVSLARLRTFR
jgi:hypothetical protein